MTRARARVRLCPMSPKVSAVLELVSELTDEERKDVRLQLELDEGAAALGRALPAIAPKQLKAIQDELAWRFDNDTGPGVPAKEALRRIRQTRSTMRKNPAKKAK